MIPGCNRERATPVPIPNTVVKPLIADGTARVTVWESRTPPGFYIYQGSRPCNHLFYGLRPFFETIPGRNRERATPVPIPNTVVKPLIADGTARVTVWESRTPPGFYIYLKGHTPSTSIIISYITKKEPIQGSFFIDTVW